MFFYYSYLADVSISGGKQSSKISTGCSRHLNRKCTFNEFIKFIDASNEDLDFDITDEERPDLRATAEKLSRNGITKALNLGRIVESKTVTKEATAEFKYAQLIERVGTFTAYSLTVTDDEVLRTNCRDSCNAIVTLRRSASSDAGGMKLESDLADIVAKYKLQELYPGASNGDDSQKVRVLDLEQMKKDYPSRTSEISSVLKVAMGGSHMKNILVLMDALKQIKVSISGCS